MAALMSAAAVSCAAVPQARIGGKAPRTTTSQQLRVTLRCVVLERGPNEHKKDANARGRD